MLGAAISASTVAILASTLAVAAPSALASANQVSIIQDSTRVLSNPAASLSTFRTLGARMVRVIVDWAQIAPDWNSRTPPPGFDAVNPADYPAAKWAPYDEVVKLARADGIEVDLTLSGGAPRWAEGPGIPSAAVNNQYWAWRPSARDFGLFAHAVGERYSGNYDPALGALAPGDPNDLPRVSFWALWNEPNFGEDLGPQAIDGSTVSIAPEMYRNLAGQAWNALQETGHRGETMLIGETAPRGASGPADRQHPQGLPGNFGQTWPLQFVRTLYCLNGAYDELRGATAKAVGCPATAAASRSFRAQNPALFQASGFADHPYPMNEPPGTETSTNPDIASFPRLPNLERALDRAQQVYGSDAHMPIYDTEYGYITRPPNSGNYVSPATAAYYINWAEYLSWKQPRIASTMQYPLYDPPPNSVVPGNGGFTSGLLFADGQQKPTYAAYRLPLYLPVTSTGSGGALEVWGCVRPAYYASMLDAGEPQSAEIQFAPGSSGAFSTVQTVAISNPNNCYFDVRLRFATAGTIRLAYTYPPGWRGLAGTTVYSRSVQVAVR